MIYGTTLEDTKFASCGRWFAYRFTIPKGTRVIMGAKDREGFTFPYWVLPFETALKLSGSIHDSKHRFVVIDAANVIIEGEDSTYN